MQNTKITSCRLCGNKEELPLILSLGEQFVNTFPESWPYDGHKCPIDLVHCGNCDLYQLAHSAPPELLYSKHYWYKSGLNNVIKEDLKDIAREAGNYLEEGDLVLDIGANDGTLLHFMPHFVKKVAVEPAENFRHELIGNANMTLSSYWPCDVFGYKFKVITAIGMFYDTENPIAFVLAVKNSLADDGIFIAQMMTAKQMFLNNDVGNLCHEHLEFYTWNSLKYLFEKCGLEIFRLEENGINGGSYRIFARHFDKGHFEYEEPLLNPETFKKRIEQNKKETVDMLKEFKERGKKVYGYGASTKFNTILQYYGVGPELLSGVIDKDTQKFGKYTLTGIPIIDDAEMKKADVLWVGPYGFLNYFMQKEIWYRGGWLVSMPFTRFLRYKGQKT